jgi:hypothetical protein
MEREANGLTWAYDNFLLLAKCQCALNNLSVCELGCHLSVFLEADASEVFEKDF